MVKGQIYGGMTMAAGMALTEDVGHDKRTGGLKNLNFENYLIPTAMDVNDNVPLLDEHYDNRTAFGGHSIGEPATEPGAAAVICAVNHALGKAGLTTNCRPTWIACSLRRAAGKRRRGNSMKLKRYCKPASLQEAVQILRETEGTGGPLLAGGTDVLVYGREADDRYADHTVVDIFGLPELTGISEDGDFLVIGAGATHTQIEQSPLVQRHAGRAGAGVPHGRLAADPQPCDHRRQHRQRPRLRRIRSRRWRCSMRSWRSTGWQAAPRTAAAT